MSKRRRPSVMIEAVESRRLMAAIAVTTLADSGAGSLRAALAAATPGDTVDASGLSGTITLDSQLAVTQNVTILGPGTSGLILDGNGHSTRAFAIDAGLIVNISGLTITDAGTPGEAGGGINVASGSIGSLTLDHVRIANALATGQGGGVNAKNTRLTLIDSTITDNEVVADSNGTANGGGVMVQDGSLTATDSTFDHNRAAATTFGGMAFQNSAIGGGVCLWGANQDADVIVGCTFFDNVVSASGASMNFASGGGVGTNVSYYGITLTHTTFAGNTASDGSDGESEGGGVGIHLGNSAVTLTDNLFSGNTAAHGPDVLAQADSGVVATYNFVSDGTESGLTDGTDHNMVGTTASPLDAGLVTLADNGGPVQTMALAAGSPAIDAGIAVSGVTADARGVAYVAAPDLGAYEAPAAGPVAVADGTLTITGTAGDDVIAVYYPAHRDGLVRVMYDGRQFNFDATTFSAVTIDAGDGNDTVTSGLSIGIYAFGGAGNDTLVGGDGDDSLSGGADSDSIVGNAGDDLLRGGGGRDALDGGDGNDRLSGGTGSNALFGDAGSDVFTSEGGTDTFYAQDGVRDHIFADSTPGDRGFYDDGDVIVGTVERLLA